MERDAKFSECGKYRYQLMRRWRDDWPMAMCIGLNPSTANDFHDDPTIRRLTTILMGKGYGGFYMCNLFALISPYPEDLTSCPDPVKDNDQWLKETSLKVKDVIFCWGNFKVADYRVKVIKKMFPNTAFSYPCCFGRNKNGSPKHPLYLKSDVKIQQY
jgi:hypothetical protein